MVDGKPGPHHNKQRFIFDAELKPKPAYYAIKKTIINQEINNKIDLNLKLEI